MRDVSRKIKTLRIAIADATLIVEPSTLELIRERQVPKGDPLEVSRVAAVQAAKNTALIIPYCHPMPVDYVGVSFSLEPDRIRVRTEVKAIHKTGVEMEALTAASVAALTLYDMLKMLDKSMQILNVRLVSKSGGKSDWNREPPEGSHAAVLVISDSVSRGEKVDGSGKLIVERLETEGFKSPRYKVVPDEVEKIRAALIAWTDKQHLDLVLTTGAPARDLGMSPRKRWKMF